MEEEKTLHEKLLQIQTELKAPKGQYNSHGGFKYRSCEDILEAVKPLLKKYNLVLTLNDEIVNIGDRYYVKAEACLRDGKEAFICDAAYAREAAERKGMDASQITGTASSYARKYALNGLFLIDDTKDADTDEHARQTAEQPENKEQPEKKATDRQIELLKNLVEDIDGMLKYYKVDKIEDLTMKQASDTITKLKKGDKK